MKTRILAISLTGILLISVTMAYIVSAGGPVVVREEDGVFMPMEWGRTKVLLGPKEFERKTLTPAGEAKYLMIVITEYATATEHKLHTHADQEEVIYILEGEGISRTKDGDKPLRPGSFAYVPAGVDHATINVRKDRPLKAIIIKNLPQKGKGK